MDCFSCNRYITNNNFRLSFSVYTFTMPFEEADNYTVLLNDSTSIYSPTRTSSHNGISKGVQEMPIVSGTNNIAYRNNRIAKEKRFYR